MLSNNQVLVVDDEIDHLDILTHHLNKYNYDVISANNGQQAIEMMHKNNGIDVVILDRMMPEINGMDVLNHMKNDEKLKRKPVIFQTALSEQYNIREGIDAGAYYYLTKPYDKKTLISLVKSAMRQAEVIRKVEVENTQAKIKTDQFQCGMARMQNATFHIRTIKGAKAVAPIVANCFAEPRKAVIGLVELLVNSVEHGNLGISNTQKMEWLLDNIYSKKLEERSLMAEFQDKYTTLECSKTADGKFKIEITDSGNGFDWTEYLDLADTRRMAPNGRGIYIASKSFNDIEFQGNGNSVTCTSNACEVN